MICVLLGGFFFSLQIEVCEKAKVLLQRLDINHNLMNTKKIHVCMHRFPCNSILFYYYYYLIYITHMNNICVLFIYFLEKSVKSLHDLDSGLLLKHLSGYQCHRLVLKPKVH